MDLGEVVAREYFQALIFKIPSAFFEPVIPADTIGAPNSFFEKYVSTTTPFAKVKIKLVQSFDEKKNLNWRDGILQRCSEELRSYSAEPPSDFFENFYSCKQWFDGYNLRNGTLIYLRLPPNVLID